MVVGIEPGNCMPEGRVEAKKNGRFEVIKPGEVREFNLEIGVIDGKKDIEYLKSIL